MLTGEHGNRPVRRAVDRDGLELPEWVPPDHPLAGTRLRPDVAQARGSWLELWFPTLAMAPAPVGLFVLWLRNPVDNPAAEATGTWSAVAVLVVGLVAVLRHARRSS